MAEDRLRLHVTVVDDTMEAEATGEIATETAAGTAEDEGHVQTIETVAVTQNPAPDPRVEAGGTREVPPDQNQEAEHHKGSRDHQTTEAEVDQARVLALVPTHAPDPDQEMTKS